MNSDTSLVHLFYPLSVAVIGASSDRKKIGYEVLSNLKRFKGDLYAVNPSAEKIQGKRAYRSVLDIGATVDLAVISVPPKNVCSVVEQCGKKGVRTIVILTAGFREAGNAAAENEIAGMASGYGMRVIGPNSVGIINNDNDLNATFVMASKKGSIAFVSQSGALSAAVIYKTVYEDIGFSKFVSLGNMADVGFSEMISYLESDKSTKSIALYMERVDDGKAFVQAARRCSQKKPIIVLKSGRSDAGRRAASSHTGSLSGTDSIYDAAFSQAGVIRAKSIEEMLDFSKVFTLDGPKGNNVCVLTNAGGPGILATDACESTGLCVPELPIKTQEKLRKILPEYAAVRNPVDTIAQARYRETYKSIRILEDEPCVDAILSVIVIPTFGSIGYSTHAKALIDGWRKTKPLVTCFMSGELAIPSRRMMLAHKIPSYKTPERAALSLGALWRYTRWYNEHTDMDQDISVRG